MGGLQGPQAHAAGVEFPAEELDRYLLVGNLSPVINKDQVRGLCNFT